MIILCTPSILVRRRRQQLVFLKHCRGHGFESVLMKLAQNTCPYEISAKIETRSLGNLKLNYQIQSKVNIGHIIEVIIMNLDLNICFDGI